MLKPNNNLNVMDVIVLMLGLLPIALYVGTPYLVAYFELKSLLWAILLQVMIFIFILLVLKLINQLSKKNREAHKNKLRKDALMEIEIQERKAELEKEKQHVKP